MPNTSPPSNKALAPFSCTYSPQLPELLQQLNCTIALSTYQAGKVVLLSAKDENTLVQLPRNFNRPMGIAENEATQQLAVASKDEVTVFSNSTSLAAAYPSAPNKFDALYMPRLTYHTGAVDIHDLSFGNDGLYAVNTLFSSIVKIDEHYSFSPVWKPPFVDAFVSEDRCHLNGMAMQQGQPKYVSAFGEGNTYQSWRETLLSSGVIYDVDSNERVVGGLAMPHSPRVFDGSLYVLLSATGELVKVDVASGKRTTVVKIEGFVRGMAKCQDYLFVGLSKLRKNSSTFAKLPFSEKANKAGVVVVHLPTGAIAGQLIYRSSVDEIYDIHILNGKNRPNILSTINDAHKEGLTTPESSFWAKPINRDPK